MKKRLLVTILIGALLFIGFYFFTQRPQEVEVSDRVQVITSQLAANQADEAVEPTSDIIEENNDLPEMKDISEDVVVANEDNFSTTEISSATKLAVPFIVQAPFGDWSELYKEACEEASVLMVHEYLSANTSFSQEEMKNLLDPMISWGIDFFDGRYDTDISETSQYFTEYLGYDPSRIQFIENPTIDEMKTLLANGLPIIVPAAGQYLGNEYFQTPGPVYHMLVIIGYDRDEFITNDPGTRRGEGYRYDQQTLLNAIHDWTGEYETILSGKKVIMVVTP